MGADRGFIQIEVIAPMLGGGWNMIPIATRICDSPAATAARELWHES